MYSTKLTISTRSWKSANNNEPPSSLVNVVLNIKIIPSDIPKSNYFPSKLCYVNSKKPVNLDTGLLFLYESRKWVDPTLRRKVISRLLFRKAELFPRPDETEYM